MTPNEEIIAFHYCLGVAITQWSNVENTLRKILVLGFEDKHLNREALSVGIFSLEGFRSKLEFTDGTISRKLAEFPQSHTKWKKLVERARTSSHQRNKLAHWAIGKYWAEASGRRVVLMPWIVPKSEEKRKPPEGSLRIRDIIRLSNDFLALARALDNFACRVCGEPERHAKSAERGDHPMTIATLRHQIREVFSIQQKPLRKKS